MTVGEDEAFNYTEVAGFVAEFCALGGKVVRRVWVPLTAQDYGPSAAGVPRDGVDGFLMAGSAATTLGVINELPQLRGNLAGKVMLTILSSGGGSDLDKRFAGVVVGMPVPVFYRGSIPPAMRAWRRYIEEFGRAFPKLAPFGGTVFSGFYTNGMDAALEALEAVGGDLSDGQHRFQAALANVRLASPTGPIRLDRNRQAVGQNFLSRYGAIPDGHVAARTFTVIPNVEQSFGGYFRTNGATPSRTSPRCVKRAPPPWAR